MAALRAAAESVLAERTVDGSAVGTVAEVLHTAAGELLSVKPEAGREILVPFVTAIVPTVDVPGGRVVLTPPGGLLARDAANLDVALPEPGDAEAEERG